MAMMRPGSARTSLSFLVVLVVLGVERSEATIYPVGNATGWGIPSDADFYEKWAEGVEFRIGDQLNFTWSGTHDVAMVTESQYDGCTTTVPVNDSTSPAIINLTTAGEHYFICTIGTHCSRGQQLKIDVTNVSTPPTSSVSPPPPPPSPPPPSASPSSGPIVALSATLSVLAFVFFLC